MSKRPDFPGDAPRLSINIFTTHTPVEAGHDRFGKDLMAYGMRKLVSELKISMDELMALGRD